MFGRYVTGSRFADSSRIVRRNKVKRWDDRAPLLSGLSTRSEEEEEAVCMCVVAAAAATPSSHGAVCVNQPAR